MRLIAWALAISFLSAGMGMAQSNQGLSGNWKFNPSKSEVRGLPVPPDPFLKVEQNAKALLIGASSQESGPASTATYPLDGTSAKRQVGDSVMNTMTKWEGSALLVNTLVSGPQNYTVMERWRKSRDGNTLTIKRTIVRLSGESESVLVYDNPAFAAAAPAQEPESAAPTITGARPAVDTPASDYVVEKGTRLLLRLTNSVNTKRTAPGDVIYFETAVPVFVNGRLVIPRGSYVTGTVTDSKESGRVKGRSSLSLRFNSLTLPNGVARDFRSRPGSVIRRAIWTAPRERLRAKGTRVAMHGRSARRRLRERPLEPLPVRREATMEWVPGLGLLPAPLPDRPAC
jgi:hypothetical protein